ncbi:hypothetical protein LINPERHAP1_LOCUS21394 [Linum perenne]
MVAWVRFPHLPIQFYHAQVLTSLGNLIGKTVKIDFNTQRAERGKFARIAIEIDLNEPLLSNVLLDGVIQNVEYENMPALCFGYGRIRHEAKGYPHLLDGAPTIAAVDTTAIGPTTEVPSTGTASTSDGYNPWMLVSRKQRRSSKESTPALVRKDRRVEIMLGSTENWAPVKER